MFLGNCMSCLEKCLFKVLCLFFSWIVRLPEVESCEFFIYFGDQTVIRGIIGKYIFPYSWFPFHFADVFFRLIFDEAFYFDEVSFTSLALGDVSVKIVLCGISEIFLPMFLSKIFMVSRFIFKSFIQLEFIFMCGVRWWLSFGFLHLAVHISNTIC